MPNEIGKLRRSSTIMTFGPGSIADFRTREGGPVSGVVAGLDAWDQYAPPPGLTHPQRISETRLQQKLNVRGFRLPPVSIDEWGSSPAGHPRENLVAVRFPDWLQCNECHRIAPSYRWGSKEGKAFRYCAACTEKKNNPARNMVFAVPVRFVMACKKGHIDDFPWHYWVGHDPDCPNKRGDLELKSEFAGLAGYILRCPDCNATRSLDGIFNQETWKGFHCNGKRPWLPGENEDCDETPRVLQRGASNMYFPVMESALSIPPWSGRLVQALGTRLGDVRNIPDEKQRKNFIRNVLLEHLIPDLHKCLEMSKDELARKIEDLVRQGARPDICNIRDGEYEQFTMTAGTPDNRDPEFEIRYVSVPDTLTPYFDGIIRAVRLREVRAILGFTRINAPENENDPCIAKLSAEKLDWLPAIEVRGEGIFIHLNVQSLLKWEQQQKVKKRAGDLNISYIEEWRSKYPGTQPSLQITARFLLIHTLAHALMKRLSYECGYSGASLRERLYVSEGESGMCGLLIYTSTSDSDGTLGGLQRQGEKNRIERTIKLAIKDMEWCSSDPLCIQNMVSAREHHSLAACHSCVLVSETSCEFFNRFLDRAMLVGLPENPDVGYFRRMLRE